MPRGAGSPGGSQTRPGSQGGSQTGGSRRGPTTGEHNRRVFAEVLGLAEDEIADLERRGVIA